MQAEAECLDKGVETDANLCNVALFSGTGECVMLACKVACRIVLQRAAHRADEIQMELLELSEKDSEMDECVCDAQAQSDYEEVVIDMAACQRARVSVAVFGKLWSDFDG